jgi:hypothetical protein
MQSFYDLQVLSEQRIAARRAQVDQEHLVAEARRFNSSMSRAQSPRLVGSLLRLRSHVVRGLAPSFGKVSPRLT